MQRKDLSYEFSRAIDCDFVELKGMLVGIANSLTSDQSDKSVAFPTPVNSSGIGKILALWSFASDGSTIIELGYLSAKTNWS